MSKLNLAATMILVVFAQVSSIQVAQAGAVEGYAVDNSQDLYRINLQTGAATLIGHTGVFFESLALSPSGQLYGADVGNQFYIINPSTGAVSLVGTTGYYDVEGMHFNGNTLLGAPSSFYPQIITIDPSTANASLLLTSPQLSGGATAMTMQDSQTALLATFRYGTYGSTYVNELRSINLETGVGTVLGTIASFTFVAGLDFGSDGILYGLDTSGNVMRVNPSNGFATIIANNGKIWLDLAAIPGASAVPEPATVTLFGAGVAMAIWAFRIRRIERFSRSC